MEELNDDLDSEESEDDEEPTGTDAEALPAWAQKKIDKLQNRVADYGFKLRKAEVVNKYGPEIADLIPPELPFKKWDEFADKAKALQAPTAQTQTDEDADASSGASEEEPTEQERRAAALVSSGRGSPANSLITDPKEAADIAISDPARYEQMKKAGLIQLDHSPVTHFYGRDDR